VAALTRRLANPLGGAIGLFLLLVAFTVVEAATPAGQRWNGDIRLYYDHAGAFLDGRIGSTPYLSWYPPLTLVPIALPRLLTADYGLYSFLFGVEMAAIVAAGLLIVARIDRGWNRALGAPAITWTYVGLALLAGFVLSWRFDALPALLVTGAVLAALGGNAVTAGVLLGLGADLKLYPAILLPAVLAWFWAKGQDRDALRAFAACSVVGLAGGALYLLFPPTSPFDLLHFQAERGLQIESLMGSLVGLLAALGAVPRPDIVFSFGSYNLLSASADAVLSWLGFAQAAVLLMVLTVVLLRAVRERELRDASARPLALSLASLLLALMLTTRVLSIQYMVWLLPLTVLLTGTSRRLGIAAAVLTALVFPFLYDGVLQLSLLPMGVLVLRNVALAAMLVVVVVRLLEPVRN
jgi:uncharacterized membrane protein